ncbi:MAG TPA: S41 family peptidase [Candidatus Polarisedimenticolia bacterium]|nr:S41 family peptidase [Candidatus Polarisedimenticolia bacterium]
MGLLGVVLRTAILVLLALSLTASPGPSAAAGGDPADTILTLMHRAADERKRGDYAAAAESYRQVLRRAPGLYEAHLFLADSLRRRRLTSGAEEEFLAARRIRPADPLPHVGLADLLRESFRFEEALARLGEGMASVPPDKSEPLVVAQGNTLRESGDPAAAAQLLTEAMPRYPGSSRMRESLAKCLMDEGKVDEAVKAFSEARDRSPGNSTFELELKEAADLAARLREEEQAARAPGAQADVWVSLARLRYHARQFSPAAEAAMEGLKRDRSRSDLRLLRALALERGPRPSEARAELTKIPKTAPEHLLALYHVAYLARLQSDDAAEARIWEEAAREHPADPTARLMLVLSWKRSSRLAKRLESFGRGDAGGMEPRAGRLLEGMAREEAGQTAEALRVYAQAFRAAPGDPEIAARLSRLASGSSQRVAELLAEKTSGAAQSDKARRAEDALLRARLVETTGRRGEAMQILREAWKAFPNRSDVARALSELSANLGRAGEDPDALLAKAMQLDPGSPWPILQKGLRLLKAGDGKGAVEQAEKALEIVPSLAEGWQLAGSARRVAGDHAGAAKDLSRALLLDPADSLGVARFQLSLALAAAGDRPAARQALEGDLPPFPELIYRLAWSFAGDTFLDRAFHGQDWQALRDRFTDPHASPARAYGAVASMLESLGDPYTRLRSTQETETLYLRARSEKLEQDSAGAPLPTSGTVFTRDLGEDIGYLRLTNFSDPSSREAIRKALEKMAMQQGLVLDLRGNAGGLVSEADAIAGMLLESGETLGLQRTASGEEVQKVAQTRPSVKRKPMVILTDRRTGSAAEKLAAGLQGNGRATVLGEGTFGKGVGQISRLLPGGPMMLVTAVESLTRGGDSLQGRGVIPDVPAGEDESIEKAREILKKPSP